jgi:hypothetical protein
VNAVALRQVCREFTVLCKELDLFGRELSFIDGTKIQAVNGKDRNFTVERLKKLLPLIEKRISEYLAELDQQDAGEAPTPAQQSLKEKLERLKERKATYEQYQQELKEEGERQISLSDEESRRMKTRDGFAVCFNAQIAVDAKHHLIAAHDVTNEVNDREQLAVMALAAKEALGVETLEVVADCGYHNATKAKECEAAGSRRTCRRWRARRTRTGGSTRSWTSATTRNAMRTSARTGSRWSFSRRAATKGTRCATTRTRQPAVGALCGSSARAARKAAGSRDGQTSRGPKRWRNGCRHGPSCSSRGSAWPSIPSER